MIIIFSIISLIYLLLIIALILGFDNIKPSSSEFPEAKTAFSIIIPFRNEAKNLPALLESIKALSYKKELFEIFLVNDASTDASWAYIAAFMVKVPSLNIQLINNNRKSNSPKKDAISTAISHVNHEWIVTTDADCLIPKNWLQAFDALIQKQDCALIVAPVTYHKVDSDLKRFQLLDFLSLMGATIGGFGLGRPFLCNGANLAYKKSLFTSVKGFDGNSDIASGDDIFLLEKAVKHNKGQVHYLKSEHAIIKTQAEASLKGLLAQRKRWAAKTTRISSVYGKFTGFIVLVMNASLICALVFTLIAAISPFQLLYLYLVKASVDLLLLFKTSRFFKQENHLRSFLLSSLIYPFFSVYVAFISMFTTYKWKGRRFSK